MSQKLMLPTSALSWEAPPDETLAELPRAALSRTPTPPRQLSTRVPRPRRGPPPRPPRLRPLRPLWLAPRQHPLSASFLKPESDLSCSLIKPRTCGLRLNRLRDGAPWAPASRSGRCSRAGCSRVGQAMLRRSRRPHCDRNGKNATGHHSSGAWAWRLKKPGDGNRHGREAEPRRGSSGCDPEKTTHAS